METPYWNPRHETLQREQLEALQLRKLRERVAWAESRVPWYAERLRIADVSAESLHGLDDLRSVVIYMRKRIPIYFNLSTAKDIMARFSYCFISPEGSDYPPILTRHSIEAGGSQIISGKRSKVLAFVASVDRLGRYACSGI